MHVATEATVKREEWTRLDDFDIGFPFIRYNDHTVSKVL